MPAAFIALPAEISVATIRVIRLSTETLRYTRHVYSKGNQEERLLMRAVP